MKIIKQCNFCNSSKFKTLFLGEDKNFKLTGKFKIVKCEVCGLIFLNPQPEKKELDIHYPSEYYSFNEIDSQSIKWRIKLLLYETYFNKNNKRILLKFLLLPFLPFSRGTIIHSGEKLLDIGCGSGQFIYEMKKMGLNVEGIEIGNIDKKIIKKNKLNIKKGDFLKSKYEEKSFDVITMNHVLEHVSNPKNTLNKIYKILKKDGILIIGIPNYGSFARFVFRRNWYQLDTPRHLYSFSDRVLINKLKEIGFEIEKIRHNARPTQFSVSLLYLLGLNSNKNWFLVRILNVFFLPLTYLSNFLKLGDQIEIYCKK